MSDNELLLAISKMLDTKLKSELQPIKKDLQEVKADVQVLKEEVQVLKENVQDLNNRMQEVEIGLRNVKLYQENDIMPRLETIESCYTDTYTRYKTYADMMESYFEDTQTLKKVVGHISEQVQKFA